MFKTIQTIIYPPNLLSGKYSPFVREDLEPKISIFEKVEGLEVKSEDWEIYFEWLESL